MAVALYACVRIGAIACLMDLRFKTAELRETFCRLRPTLYLGEEQLSPPVETGPGGAYTGALPWWALLIKGASTGPLPLEPDQDMPAILATTSGTTGQPKFVTHAAATLSAITETFLSIDIDAGQTELNSCPMAHASGCFTFLAAVAGSGHVRTGTFQLGMADGPLR
jgi:long-chain acyl-CoA synthetase